MDSEALRVVLLACAAFLGAAVGPYIKLLKARANHKRQEKKDDAELWQAARDAAAKPWRDAHAECMEGREEDQRRIASLENEVGKLNGWREALEEGLARPRAGRRATDPEVKS